MTIEQTAVPKVSKAVITAIGDVLMFLENHQGEWTRRLFPGSSDEYRQNWIRLYEEYGASRVWARLDNENRARLVGFAYECYHENN